MPFYIRKGINFGPLRVNLSKGGIGLSVGGKGLRAGVDAQGRTYTHAGRGGIYHRSSTGGFTLPWIVILLLGSGLWYAQSHGWLDQWMHQIAPADTKHRHEKPHPQDGD